MGAPILAYSLNESACLKLYVETIGKENTIGMFNVAIESIKYTKDNRILH